MYRYFKNHPSEHRNMAKFIADSYSAGQQEAPKLAAAPTDNKFVSSSCVCLCFIVWNVVAEREAAPADE